MTTKAIFLDAPALWYGARKGWQRRPDYARLRSHLVGADELVSASVFLVDRIGLEGFEAALRHMGYNTLVVPTGQCCDSYICRAALASPAKTIAIAGGSGIYEPLFTELRRQDKQIEFHAFPANAGKWPGINIQPLGEDQVEGDRVA